MKEVIRSAVSRFVALSGLGSVGRRIFPKHGSIILCGHRITDNSEGYLSGLRPSWFAEQIEYLTQHYEIISLSELTRCFENREMPPQNSAILTFDDGFRDNFENAFPVLEKHRIPATIFAVTGCLSDGELPWSQQLGYLFQESAVRSFRTKFGDCEHFDLTDPARRERAYAAVKTRVRRMGRIERHRIILEISAELEVNPPGDRMLTWEQAKVMQGAGIEFGAHTFSHSLLANIGRDEARWEMEKSKDDLRQHLGITRPHFCFPAGSYNSELVDMVKALGFRSVFQSRSTLRVNSPDTTNQFALSRVGLPNAPAYILEAELDGPLHTIRRLYRH